MKVITKHIKVIQMSEEEIEAFHKTMEAAREGHTSHYAEQRLSDGSFLGVQLVSEEEQRLAEIDRVNEKQRGKMPKPPRY